MPSGSRVGEELPLPSGVQLYIYTSSVVICTGVLTVSVVCTSVSMLSYISVVPSSVSGSSSREGDSTELMVLWESVVGLALIRLLLLVLVVFVLLVGTAGALPGGECRETALENPVSCDGGVAGRTWLSLHTECLACCNCEESWEKVYCRILACVTAERWPSFL